MAVAMPTVAQAPPAADQPVRMTYEEFQAWAGEDTHAEWVNGEVIVQMPTKEAHQNVVKFLLVLLDLFVRLFKLGQVQIAPFEMRAVPGGSAREPDLMFVAAEHLDRLSNDRLAGPADLVVEVISDDSVYRDRVDKFDEYEAAGVREYWMIDPRPDRRRADLWVLDERGRYRAGDVSREGVYRSTVLPGLWLRVEWLLADTLPDPLATLAQVVGPDKIIASLQG
jgi:Uma2 family endonuclease